MSLVALFIGIPFLGGAQAVFSTKDDLYTKSGNVLTVSPLYHPDSVLWTYSVYNEVLHLWTSSNSRANSIIIFEQTEVELKVYSSTGNYIKEVGKEMPTTLTTPGSDFLHPITDSLVVQTTGLKLRPYSFLHADSVIWNIRANLSHDSITLAYSAPLSDSAVTILNNATVIALVKSGGLWYEQLIQFNGVTQDAVSKTIMAAIVPGAHYQWYLDNELLPVDTYFYTPTQVGTYKVVITWGDAGVNQRLETANKAEFVIVVTSIHLSTGLEAGMETSSTMEIYPNPASDKLSISHLQGTFAYSIENLQGEKVASGTMTTGADLYVGHLARGMYLLRIQSEGKELSKKVVLK